MKIKRSPSHIFAYFSAVLIGFVLLTPARAFATGSADSIERWNIAMTDFSAGLPLFALPPFVEMRVYAMAHIAMLNAVKSVSRPYNAGSTSADAAVAAAAHDVVVAEFGKFSVRTRPSMAPMRRSWLPFQMAPPRIAASPLARPPPPQCSRADQTKT